MSFRNLSQPLTSSVVWCRINWALDSILMFPYGYDTLEYSRVKAYDDIHALADSIRDIAKRQHTSKKSGRKIFSSLHRISGISFFRRFTTCTERFLLQSFRKKFPSSATASYTSGCTSPIRPAGMILCKRTWQEWVLIQPWTFEPSAVM